MRKRLFLGTFLGILSISGLCGVTAYLFPIEVLEAWTRFEFWRGHVQETQRNGIHGYLYNSCPQDVPASGQECACIALIHGLGDNAMTWKKILLWPEQKWKAMGLTEPLRIYAVDLPGTGRSSPASSPNDYRVRRQAEILKAVLSSSCREWVVVGNSLGGWIAAWIALDWPEGVRRLVLLDSAGLKINKEDREKMGSLLANPTVESLKEFQKRAYDQPRVMPDYVWNNIVIKARAQASHTSEVITAQTDDDYLDLRLSTIHRPTLILWGKEDRIIPLSIGKEMRDLMHTAVWREVSHCGHLPQKECPLAVIRSIIDMVQMGAV